MKNQMKQWTKQCRCSLYIPDEYDICDNCLLIKVGLADKIKIDSQDVVEMYSQDDVLIVLRKLYDRIRALEEHSVKSV